MTLTKATLVDHICKANDMNRKQAIQAVETILEIMKSNLQKGDDILLSGFGKFNVKDKKIRKGRNPKTGEEMMLDARKVNASVYFKPNLTARPKEYPTA